MQVMHVDSVCPECSERLLDMWDEMVCPRCGISKEKQVVDASLSWRPKPRDAVRQPLGSYMGPLTAAPGERSTRGITGSAASYDHLKAVSDFAGRDEGSPETCARMIERVGEKLSLPRVVLLEAASMAKQVLAAAPRGRRTMLAAVSAYSMISACRVESLTAVSPREIIAAHAALGRRVDFSSILHLGLESPIRTFARGPEGYVLRVLARLSANRSFLEKLAKEGVRPASYLKTLRESAMEVLGLADRTELLGKRPYALAASAVYSSEVALAACEGRNRRLTQRVLAECGNTSEYTVRDQCALIFTPAVEQLVARRRRPPAPAPAR